MKLKFRVVCAGIFLYFIVAGQNSKPPQPVAPRDLTRAKPDPGRLRGPQDVPRGYALVIGISKYQKLPPADNLRYPESDAAAMYRVLISQEGGAFPSENVHQLLGPNATAANIRHELEEWLPSVARESDRVVVYFAGHGFVVGSRGFLAPYDIDISNVGQTAYPMDRLGRIMAEKVKARWKALFVDACHSGKITPETTDETVDDQLATMPKTFLTFTATKNNEQSFEAPKLSTGFGVFTYFLVQGLQGNADNDPCDGIVTADELIEYVRAEVKKYTREHGASQTPQERGDYEGDMILAVRHVCSGGSLPPESMSLGSIVVETTATDVQVYVDDKPIGMASSDKPLSVPGLSTGIHKVMGVRKGYEPAIEEVMVVPGQERSVKLRIQYRREYKKSSTDLVEKGEARLFKKVAGGSSFNPVAVYNASGQTASDLKEAKEFFTQALTGEPSYERAAFDLAMTCQLLSDHPCALKYFRAAAQIEPTDASARIELGGALIEDGDADEAVRQLTEALRLEPDNALAHSHLSRAYLDKAVWTRSVEEANAAIARNPGGDQAYLWKADALRHQAAAEKNNRDRKTALNQQAAENFRTFIRLTNFSSPVYEQFAYYAIGFGLGSRKHADRKGSYIAERSMAYMGLCNSEHMLGNLLQARDACRRAIHYDPNEPLAYFFLGDVNVSLFNSLLVAGGCPNSETARCREYLLTARENYQKVLEINPDLEEARKARAHMESIDGTLPLIPKTGY